MAARRGRCFRLEICRKRAGTWTLEPARPLGRTLDGAHGDHGWAYVGNRGRQPGLPRSQLSFGRQAPPAGASVGARHQRPVRIVSGRLARYPPLARSQPLGRALSIGSSHRRGCRKHRPIASSRQKAMACIRSRSVPCMRESSSPGISGLRQAARPWSGWKSGSDIPTRVSRG